LTGGQRVALLAEATQYGVDIARGQTQFRSNAQYLAYRKAQTVARSTNGPGPVPSVIVTDLQATYQDPRNVIYNETFNFLTSPSTTVINSTGQGYIGPPMPNTYWKVSDTSSSVWAYMPNLTAVHQITSITLSYYSGFNKNVSYISDATFRMTRDKNPFVAFPDTVSLLLFYAYQKRVVPAQAGDTFALGSPDQATAGPITYPNTPTTITDPAFLRAFFGNGTDVVDRTKGIQFHWFTGYLTTFINNSQINEFTINYTYTQCPAIPYNIPNPPFSPLVEGGDGSAVVSWSPSENGGGGPIAYYIVTATPEVGLRPRVQYGTEYESLNGVYYPAPGAGVIRRTAPTSPMTITGLTNGTTYTCTVVAVAAGGTSVVSDSSDPVTPLALPGAPLSFVANAYDGLAILTWTAPLSDDSVLPVTGYHIITSPSGPVLDILESPATISGLTNGTAYTFSIQSRSSNRLSIMAISNSVIPYGSPDPPANFTATPGDRQMSLSWNTPTNTGGSPLSHYSITVKYSFGWTYASYPYVAAPPFIVPNLSNGTPYKISILAVNQAFRTSYSSTINSATPYRVPDTPTLTASIVGVSGEVLIQWSAPATGGSTILSYTLTSSSNNTNVNNNLATLSTTLIDLSANTDYTFTVTANNAAGSSVPSQPSPPIRLTVPSAPLAVIANATDTQATVAWSPPTSNGGFSITGYVVTSSPGGYTMDVSGTLTQATVVGLTNGVSYTFTVVAKSLLGLSVASSASIAVTPYGPLAPPTQVTASFNSTNRPGKIIVSWTAPVGPPIARYTVTCQQTGTIFPAITAPALSLDVSGLALAASYSFTVVATTAGNVSSVPSAPSNLVLFGPPLPPTGVSAVPDNTTAFVSWTLPVTDGGYPILYYTVRADPGSIMQSVIGSAVSSMVFTGLTAGTPYSFSVLAGNQFYPSDWSDPSVFPLTASTDVIAVPGTYLANVTWTAPNSTGGLPILCYLVNTHLGGITVVPPTPTHATIAGLVNGISYYFTVVAVTQNDAKESLPSNTIIPAFLPTAPTDISGTPANQQIAINWQAASNGGSPITKYTISVSPGVTGFPQDVAPNVRSLVVSGLTNGTGYIFTIVAWNTTGPSSPASSVSITPATVPNAPTGVNGSAGNQLVNLNWSAPGNNGGSTITSYTVTWSTGSYTTANATPSATITGLIGGTSYTFTVVATNSMGSGAASSPYGPLVPVVSETYDVLTSPSTTNINSTGQGLLIGPSGYWKVSDTSSSVWSYMPNLFHVSQISSVELLYYSGFNQPVSYVSDARFTLERDSNPLINSILLFYANQKRVYPRAGDSYAIGSPPQNEAASPITYANGPVTITDTTILQNMFGNGTNTIDRAKGMQFYWFTGYRGTAIYSSHIDTFVIHYTYP
jgi:hypothetical protein